MIPRDKLGFAVALGVGLWVWFAYPLVMAAVLLAFLVFSMLILAVMAMMRVDKRRLSESKAQHALRLVNEQEPRWHHWR